ncbi:hypothetical protein SUGI_0665670 [Cryptomeria japonica]|nr:hypothetical protein SUGI_0665670 [Cryptomeria japonica]
MDGSQRMLVYECMQNGSLNSFLSHKSKEEDKVLDWEPDLESLWALFGMTLLELISGQQNSDLSIQDSQHYFPTWEATQINKGNTIDIVDERIANKADIEEVRRAAVVSFLCIQMDENE